MGSYRKAKQVTEAEGILIGLPGKSQFPQLTPTHEMSDLTCMPCNS